MVNAAPANQVLNGPQGNGVGTYSIEVRHNATTPLQGCLLAGTMLCPSVFSFAYYSAPATLARCASSGACAASGVQYTIPLMDQGAVTGCGTGSCPDAFPVPAAAAGGAPVTCLTTRSQCASVSGNFVFSLFRSGPPAAAGSLPMPVLERCIPSPAGITTCSSITGYTGLELHNSLGALVGCTTINVTTCPRQFPFSLYDAAGGLVSCRANITGSCGAATGNQFPTQIFDDRVRALMVFCLLHACRLIIQAGASSSIVWCKETASSISLQRTHNYASYLRTQRRSFSLFIEHCH
jgi:hypothetical protein